MGISFNTNCNPKTSKTCIVFLQMKTAWIFFAIMAMIVVTNAEFTRISSTHHYQTTPLSHSQKRAITNFANR